eukprot:2470253-Pyramimonas_sp.AAC.1
MSMIHLGMFMIHLLSFGLAFERRFFIDVFNVPQTGPAGSGVVLRKERVHSLRALEETSHYDAIVIAGGAATATIPEVCRTPVSAQPRNPNCKP